MRGAPLGYRKYGRWPEIRAALREPLTLQELARDLGIARETARDYVDRMRQDGAVRVHEYGGGNRPRRYVARY